MINHDLITEKQDLTYLEWDKTRESSGTGGSFLKAYELVNGKKIYYKLSAYDPINGITGRECFNELIVSRFLDILNVRHLNYQLIHADVLLSGKTFDTFLCASEDFKEKGDRKITLEDEYALEKEDNETILSFCERMGWLSYIFQMIVIDFLIINRDRHGANIEIIDHNGHKEPAPFFDHGLSLIFSCHDEQSINDFDPMADLPVQSYFGSHSLFTNLKLIPADQLPVFRRLDPSDKDYLFQDLYSYLPAAYIEKIWQILFERWSYYESLRNRQ